MNIFDLLQLIGGFILCVGEVPQIMQMVHTKSVQDLNFATFASIFLGVLLMEIYAIHLVVVCNAGLMFLITNSLSLLLAGIICVLILRYRSKLPNE